MFGGYPKEKLCQVLIVAGGFTNGDGRTTEKHVIGENSWKVINPLPRYMRGLMDATVTIKNKIYIFGKKNCIIALHPALFML